MDVIRTLLSYIFYSMTASIGNYNATESKEANEKMFYNLFFASFWLYGFTGICLGVLLNPFIALWIGEDYLLPSWTVFIIIVNYYTAGVSMLLSLTERSQAYLRWGNTVRSLPL